MYYMFTVFLITFVYVFMQVNRKDTDKVSWNFRVHGLNSHL